MVKPAQKARGCLESRRSRQGRRRRVPPRRAAERLADRPACSGQSAASQTSVQLHGSNVCLFVSLWKTNEGKKKATVVTQDLLYIEQDEMSPHLPQSLVWT